MTSELEQLLEAAHSQELPMFHIQTEEVSDVTYIMTPALEAVAKVLQEIDSVEPVPVGTFAATDWIEAITRATY
jgi:hypothetical protein